MCKGEHLLTLKKGTTITESEHLLKAADGLWVKVLLKLAWHTSHT